MQSTLKVYPVGKVKLSNLRCLLHKECWGFVLLEVYVSGATGGSSCSCVSNQGIVLKQTEFLDIWR